MKFEAHPLVVAAALGLIGPGALPGALGEDLDDDTEDRPERIVEVDGWEPDFSELQAPAAEEFHRVELEWLKLEKS